MRRVNWTVHIASFPVLCCVDRCYLAILKSTIKGFDIYILILISVFRNVRFNVIYIKYLRFCSFELIWVYQNHGFQMWNWCLDVIMHHDLVLSSKEIWKPRLTWRSCGFSMVSHWLIHRSWTKLSNVNKVWSKGANWQHASIRSGIGLVLNRRQAINGTCGDTCHMASLVLCELNSLVKTLMPKQSSQLYFVDHIFQPIITSVIWCKFLWALAKPPLKLGHTCAITSDRKRAREWFMCVNVYDIQIMTKRVVMMPTLSSLPTTQVAVMAIYGAPVTM